MILSQCCHAFWILGVWQSCPICRKRLVPPKGSDSRDLLPDTRSGAGDETTCNGSEKPLPDQGQARGPVAPK